MVNIPLIKKRLSAFPEDMRDYFLKKNSAPVYGLPILIAGSIRSGTTMFSELFNNGRLLYYHEPFIRKSLVWDSTLPLHFEDPANMNYARETWNNIRLQQAWSFYRKTNAKHPYISKSALHRILPFAHRRILIKDPSLSYWMDGLIEITGPAQPIFLLRDPRAIAGSIKKLGWDPGNRIDRILANHRFQSYQSLLPEGVKAIHLSSIERIAIQTAILHSALYQQHAKIEHAILVYFEELILSTDQILSQLATQLQLPNDFFEKSYTSNILNNNIKSGNPHQYRRDSKAQITAWKNILTPTEEHIILDIYHKKNPPYKFSAYAE